MLRFSGKRGQRGNVESCMLLENGLTRSLLARASQRSPLAVRKFCTFKSEERFAQGYDRCLQTLLLGEEALETHRNDRSYSSDSGRSTFFERNSLFSVMAYSKFWKVIPQFVPLKGLHAKIFTFRVGAMQTERLRILVQLKFVREKMKMGVAYAHIERATGKWLRSIELTDGFLVV